MKGTKELTYIHASISVPFSKQASLALIKVKNKWTATNKIDQSCTFQVLNLCHLPLVPRSSHAKPDLIVQTITQAPCCCFTSQQVSAEQAPLFYLYDFRQQQAGLLLRFSPTCHLWPIPAVLLFYLLPNQNLYDSLRASSSPKQESTIIHAK